MQPNLIDFLILPLPLEVYLFHPCHIGIASLLSGMAFGDTGSDVPVSIVISLTGVVTMEVSSCAN